MKVLMINGSPRKSGCTYTALKEIETVLNKEGIDTEIINVPSNTESCMACGSCHKTNRCVKNIRTPISLNVL